MPDPAHLAGVVTAGRPADRLLSYRTAIEAALTAVVTTVLTLLVFGPIWSQLSSPLGTGDLYATYVNADVFGGFGYSTTTQFGFPRGMNLNYTPNLDLTENAFAHLVDLMTGSPFTGINILLFVSFPLVAVLAYLMLRLVGGRGPLAIALATAFSLIPFHFGRGLGHTYLATLYSSVTALTLALVIGLGLVSRIAYHPDRLRRVVGWLALAALVVVTAWSGLYYAAFALILGAAAIVWRFAQRDRWRDLGLAALPVVGVGVLAVAGFLPGLLTTMANPPTQQLAERTPYESVTFAGNLAMALIPAPISQLPGMWRYNEAIYGAINAAPQLENNALTNFGTWITSACVLVFVVGMAVLARRGRLSRSAVPLLAYLTAVALLFFVPWGLNYLVAGVLTPQVRAWNRLVPILLLLFVAGAAAVLSRTRLGRLSVVSTLAAVAIVAVVAVEQVLPFRAAYAEGAANGTEAVAAARAYAAELNAAIPADCGVLQLPYVVYPEQGSIEELGDYEHFLQGLVNPDKDFSYGAVTGTTAAEPLMDLGNRFSPAVVDQLVAEGFCAVHVDRRGFTDTAWTWVNAGLRESFGAPVATGDDGTWLAYALPSAS
jgi:hypothetical protein